MNGQIEKQSVKFCTYCGVRFANYDLIDPKYCPNCGKQNWAYPREKKPCLICFNPIIDGNFIQCPFCGVLFHRKCLQLWLSEANSCPFCMNAYLIPDNLVV